MRTALVAALVIGVNGLGRAETVQQRMDRLERGIDIASELGRFDRVQFLRRELASEAARAGSTALAARQYELLLASRPPKRERVKLFVELARMRRTQQNYAGAISAYQDARHDDRDNWDANLELAQTYAQLDLNVNARDTYLFCVKLSPRSVEAYQGLAGVYQRQGYLNKALENYQKALSIEKRPSIYLAMADCYVRMDQMDKATDILAQGKAMLPGADYDARVGDIYHRRGDLKDAAKAWEDALSADARRDDIRLKLAMIYERMNRSADTDRMLRKLEGSYPKSPLVHFLRGWVLYDRGDRSGALSEIRLVQSLSPTDLVKHYNDQLMDLIRK